MAAEKSLKMTSVLLYDIPILVIASVMAAKVVYPLFQVIQKKVDKLTLITREGLTGTITEVNDIANLEETLATRPDHEAVTDQIRELFRQQGIEPYILSTEACSVCDRCAWLDGQPCRHPERMHPCVESHGINLIPTLEENGLPFQYGDNIVTWYSLFFF